MSSEKIEVKRMVDEKRDGCGCVSVLVAVTFAIFMVKLLIGVATYQY